MEADSIAFRHWDDVVFENRNKLYGAYLLRRTYANHLLSGMGVTILAVAVILSLPDLYSAKPSIKEVLPPLSETKVILTQPPSLKDIKPPKRSIVPPSANVRDNPVVVTRDEVIEEEELEAVIEFVSGDDVGSGDIGPPEATGNLSLPEPEPVMEERVVQFAEVMPQYEGGLEAMMKFIQKKIRYPRVPRQIGIDGTVYVGFVVNGNGLVTDVHIVKGVHPDYDKEAMRVISMLPLWKGGSHNGRPVSVRMVLPIKFALQK